jgi:hypothetical protein
VVASEETESSVFALSRNKRTHREDAGGDLGRAKEERRVPQVEAGEVEGGAAELDRQEKAAVDATTDAVVTAEAGLARIEETATTEVVVSRPATDEVVAREVTVVDASSGPASREDPREVAEEAAKEALAGVRASKPSETISWASSGLGPAPGAKADMPVSGTEIGAAAGPLLFGATSGSEKVSQGAHASRTMESDRSKASPTPRATARGASGGKVLAASTGSGASSQSSASLLQKEWADTASSARPGGGRDAQGDNLTLAEVSKQLSTVRTSLRNVSLQFIEAAQTVNVSNMFSAFDFFCWLHRCTG